MSPFTQAVVEAREAGFTMAEALEYARGIAGDSVAQAPVKAAKAPASPKGKKPRKSKFFTQVIVPHAKASAARKALAAKLRADGLEPRGEVWEKAKAEAGL